MKLYLAGPDVFRPDARAIAARKKALCAQYGMEGLDPLDQDPPASATPEETGLAIYRANRALMLAADAIIADLSPFRGPSADPGTVFEFGFMLGQGKPAWGYSTATAPFHDRTRALPGATQASPGHWVDAEGLVIENFGLNDNLMIDGGLVGLGHPLITGLDAMAGFERCLRLASAWRAQRP